MIIPDEPFADYLANQAWGSSQAKTFLRSPLESHDERCGIKPTRDSAAFQVGRLAHMMVLEPARFDACTVTEGPINERTGKPYGRDTKAFADWQAEHPDVTVVEPWLYTMLERMPAQVCEILAHGRPEVTVRLPADEDYPAMQCRPDWSLRDLSEVHDLKTIDRLEDIDKAIISWKYWLQQGWYEETIRRETGCRPQLFRFIFCEKSSPFRWQIITLDDAYVEHARMEAYRLALDIRATEKADDWRDYTDLTRTIAAPEWLLGAFVETEEGISL